MVSIPDQRSTFGKVVWIHDAVAKVIDLHRTLSANGDMEISLDEFISTTLSDGI